MHKFSTKKYTFKCRNVINNVLIIECTNSFLMLSPSSLIVFSCTIGQRKDRLLPFVNFLIVKVFCFGLFVILIAYSLAYLL